MKSLLFITPFLFPLAAIGQQNKIDFTAIDQKVQQVKTSSPAVLTQELTFGYSTDIEKVRAIFRWIADNIEYKLRDNGRHPQKGSQVYNASTDTGAIKPLDERVAEDVLRNGTAVCDGYARLFKSLCDHAGIQAEIITGYARGSKGARRFGSNHTWNAVLIDNKWALMDPTWACGYISWHGDRFIQEFDEIYFMTDPEKFIEEHYPDNLRWTLMDDPPLMGEFRNSPYKQKTYSKYSIKSYSPQKGLLEVVEGDTLNFELVSTNMERDFNIFSDLFPDPSVYKTASSVLLSPSVTANNKTTYTYQVVSPEIKWIYLLYNEDVVLRYRIVIKKEKEGIVLQ